MLLLRYHQSESKVKLVLISSYFLKKRPGIVFVIVSAQRGHVSLFLKRSASGSFFRFPFLGF